MSQAIDEAPAREAAALIRAIAERRDRAAFAALFVQYAPRLKAYMRRLGAADDAAEEIVQETMLMVWRKAALFDPARAAASTWIFTILRNLRIDMLRRSRPLPPELAAAGEAAEAADADDLIDAAQRTARLRAALASLPAEQAEVVRLSFFDERPHAEIERALGIPLGTVKSRLRLAMARLRRVLEGEE
ncbi:MAG TPA: sigma-70 family RNA polymerase sigma factor [Alphaproteobacteria bacterium]|nr:sigma-70 family RNA polymerase sigma factor [Alphaproteobacteria bacterium]